MHISTRAIDALRGLKHPLTVRLGLLLSLFIVLMLAAYAASGWAVGQMAHDGFVLNIAGRQRAFIQIYTRQVNRGLVSLAISDWETLLEERSASASTARFFETTHQAFLEGGVTRFGAQSAQELRLPRTSNEHIRASLADVSREWTELKRVAGLALRSDAKGLKDNEYIHAMQRQCTLAAAAMDSVVSQMQQDSENKLHRIEGFQAVTTGLGCFLLVGIMFFVHFRMVTPLDRTSAGLAAKNRELRESEEKYRAIIESAADAIFVVDAETGIILDANKQAEKLLGIPVREIVGMDQTQLHPKEEAERYSKVFERHVRRSGAYSGNLLIHHKDGRDVPVEITSSVMELGSRKVITGIFRDVSERKRAEVEREALQRQLQETSRRAGMAEVASGVLHNVGNVLNSVNVSASVVADKLRKSRVSGLAKVAKLMREHADDLGTYISEDEKGRQLPGYIGRLAEHLADEQTATLEELQSLTKNIDHIKDIVSMQQSYTGVSGTVEKVVISSLLDDALMLNAASFERHGIDVTREYKETPPVLVDKSKLLQILVNLVRNAKHAIYDRGDCDLRLTLRVGPTTDDRVRIEVADDGVGIPEENLTRIFSYGFTTKKDGHGLGLHTSAIAATEMGGSLTAHSDGPGKGATFTLELPIQPAEVSP